MAKLKTWTVKHAFRDEMSQIIHWSLIWSVTAVLFLQLNQASAAVIKPVNLIYSYLMF